MSTDAGPVEDGTHPVLQLVYDAARQEGQWPRYAVVDVRLDRLLGISDGDAALQTVPEVYLPRGQHSFGFSDSDEIRLTLRGVAQCATGSEDLALLVRFIGWVTEREQHAGLSDDADLTVTSSEFAAYLGWSLGSPRSAEANSGEGDMGGATAGAVDGEVLTARAAMVLLRLLADRLSTFSGSTRGADRAWEWTYTIIRRRLRIYRGVTDLAQLLDLVEPGSAGEAEAAAAGQASASDLVAVADRFEFDVAVSFAGEDRDYVQAVVDRLKAADVRVFYDRDFQADMWGQDLPEYFDGIYRSKARYAVMFISRHYASKMWTRHERRSALARGLADDNPYVLPVRLDDTELAGLRPTIGYLDARLVGLEGIVDAVLRKLERVHAATGGPLDPARATPRTEAERQQLLLDRPPGWEYLYFAGQLLHERDRVEGKFRDHEISFAAPNDALLDAGELGAYVRRCTDAATALVDTLMRLMEPSVQARAFGEPGQPGDPERLKHLAARWNTVYEGLLDWAASIRGTNAPTHYRPVLELLARFVDEPVQAYRAFVDDLVARTDPLSAQLAAGEAVNMSLSLELTIAAQTTSAFTTELHRVTAGE